MSTRYLTTTEVAEMCRVSPETARWWRYANKGPRSLRIPGGRRVLYAAEDVEAWLEGARADAPSPAA
ncbi:MAG TPA: helix-turn-helix domain-containing protein [Coriobacteriia bacterium]|nr:helix-turn-helix domain-containing protein [Coriobacteriia bacterium]